MSAQNHNIRYLILLPLATAAVLLSTLGVDRLAGNVLLILAASATVLLGLAFAWARREGLASPVPIVAIGLLVYFPVRGIVLITSGLTNDQGINQRVLDAIARGGALIASLEVLVLAATFAVSCEVLWRLGLRSRPDEIADAVPVRDDQGLQRWATVLLIIGLVGIVLQVPAGLGWLRGDEASGGLDWYLIYLAGFGFSLGIVLSGRANGRLPIAVWLLLGAVGALAFYMGSKDTLFQPLLALLFAGAGISQPKKSGRRTVGIGLTLALLVFVIFPAVTTYRNEIFSGQSFGQALSGVPGELVSKTVVGSVPRTGGVAGYLDDSLLYLTNRLSGFDSVLLATDAPRDTKMLTVQSIVLSPLGLVMPSGYWSSSVSQPGHYFGQQYWGSVPGNNVSIAITIFGEVQLAFGGLAIPLAAMVLALVTTLAARYYRARNRAARALGMILMVTAIGFEHDVLYLLITTERRLALLGIVVGLAATGHRRLPAAPWAASANTPMTGAGAGS